jgi:hypothetical protein
VPRPHLATFVALVAACGGGHGAPDASSGSGEPVTAIATGQTAVTALAVASADVLWTAGSGSSGRIMACPFTGGCDATTAPLTAGVAAPNAIATDGSDAWFGDGSAVRTCAITSCAPTTIAAATAPVQALLVDGSTLYVASGDLENGGGGLSSCTLPGCNPLTPVGGNTDSVFAIAVDATSVYWSTLEQIWRRPITGSAADADIVVNDDEITALVSDGSALYWTVADTVQGAIRACTLPACSSVTTVAATQATPFALTADAANLYWTDADTSNAHTCPKAAAMCSPRLLAADVTQPTGIAVAGSAVYFVADQTTIDEVAAP